MTLSRASAVLTLTAALTAAARPAAAQRGVDDQVFKPGLDAYGIFGSELAQTSRQWDFGFRFTFQYAQNPLHLPLISGTAVRDISVVENAARFHLGAYL